MPVPRTMRLLAAVRHRVNGGNLAQMTPEQIAAGRGPHVPEGIPLVGPALVRLAERVTGRVASGVQVTEVVVPGATGPLPARRHEPPTRTAGDPLVLHLHGGGWALGSPQQYDWLCSELAARLGAVVVSVDYRMAPEHPAPAAVDDCVAVARWILADGGGAVLGAAGPLVVIGDSAGGNLSALVAIAMRDAGLEGLAAQLLIYPSTDLAMSSSSAQTLRTEPFLHRSQMDDFTGAYLGELSGEDPRVSPMYVEDLHGLAPALVQTAEFDPLKDEGRAYADRMAQAGVTVRHTEYADMPHGFASMPGLAPAARQALAEMVQFTRPLLAKG